MDQKVLNLLARASAEFNALGDDDHSGMIMGAVEWLVAAHGLPQETFDQANELYISLRDLSITDIPDNGWPEEAENCVAVMLEGSEELISGAKLLTECAALLKDYWAERNVNRE